MAYIRITKDERKSIEQMLKNGCCINQIAKALGRCFSTIEREIKNNRTQTQARSAFNKRYPDNNCRHADKCQKHHLCSGCNGTINACRHCIRCNAVCETFEPAFCSRRDQTPGCCNGCKKRKGCHLVKYDYHWKEAHVYAEKKKRLSRSGIAANDAELAQINRIVSPLLKKGQSIHSIYQQHKGEIPISERSLYNYVAANFLDADVFDLLRKLGRKPSRRRPEKRTDRTCHLKRTYEDYQLFLQNNPGVPVVQMDCVEGCKSSSKVLLCLKWVQSGFYMAFLLESQTSGQVSQLFRSLQQAMGPEKFRQLFPVILTDRGSEFTDPKAIEFFNGEKVTHVFYCDPRSPQQKAHVENENAMMRRKFPKGTNFDPFEQDDVLEALSNINSYRRPSKGEKAPLELFLFTYGKEVLEYFPLTLLDPDEVNLRPCVKKKAK